MTNLARISLDYAVNQAIEWNHGRTNIDYDVIDARIKHGGAEANVMSCQIDMNTARVSGLVHPCGLVVEEVRLSIACTLEDSLTAPTKVAEIKKIMKGIESKEVFHVEPGFFSLFSVRPDRAGSASISVTTIMKMYDKGEKAITTYFWFRNGLLHKVR
jgi:hypothetical protein